MSDDIGKSVASTEVPDVSPGAGFQVFVDMANLYNKLKLLNYDDDYVMKWRMKPISRIHFAVSTNPGDQLHAFIALSAWLFQKGGLRFDKPSEDDDQSVLLQNIIAQFKKLFSYLPEKPDELPDADDSGPKDDDNEIDVNKIDEEMFNRDTDADEYEEDEAVLNMEALTKLGLKTSAVGAAAISEPEIRPELIMESTTDATEWKLEVERILPQLKVTFKAENKDWRSRQEQRLTYKTQIATSLKDAEQMLTRFHTDIAKSLEKIITREQYINSQLNDYLHEFHRQQDLLAQAKQHYRHCSSGITDKSQQLAQITAELTQIKEEMEETGQNVTDGGPLVKIKKAIEELNRDIIRVDVRIAVLEHTLMQSKVREKEEANDEKADYLLNEPDFE
ncbi:unnamed protein product [Rotaria sp. Silwood1]|nr:unnamed protein product [Rotaria sp. Silwood1]CAF3624380.1 unnamed protein product [Rotaria sp. Silwood1]CAF4673892.1 unnamed protein product [Rotaria sp. Silwood1]CAF4847242.1 unnamed protein product [Rotaria sp. Silwood1]CAF4866464.1 unnamed protein product [Rotaria sp. Silwood1]